MIPYNATKPLISLHIPKCAGQTFRQLLEQWFGNRFFAHYFQQHQSPPPKHPLKPGICIHGHFNQSRGFGVEDYYPEVDQFITVLRDPLDAAVSNYFYWKTKARNIQLKNGTLHPGSADDYKNIDDFFKKRATSNMLDFMPGLITKENYREIIETKFVWIGLAENIQTHVNDLATALGFPSAEMGRLNTAIRDEELSSAVCNKFIENNPLEFDLYRYVRDRLMKKE